MITLILLAFFHAAMQVQAGTPVTTGSYCQCNSRPSLYSGTSSTPPSCSAGGTVYCDAALKRYSCYAAITGHWTTGPQYTDFSYTQSQCVNKNNDQICMVTGASSAGSCITSIATYRNNYQNSNPTLQFYQACWEGHETGTNLVCTPCKQGRYRGNTDTNTHVVDVGVFCRSCPAGYFAAGTAYKICDACAKGQFQTSCSKEDADSNGSNDGCIRCKNCPAGKYQDQTGSSLCINCDKGKFSSEIGQQAASTCSACQAGLFASDKGSTLCTKCPKGWKSAHGAQLCTVCDSGQYSSIEGSTNCTLCEKGKIASSSGLSSCTSCGGGEETNKESSLGGISCRPCAAGRFEKLQLCTDCPTGWNQITTQQTACTECPVGRFAPASKTTAACSPCQISKYQSETRQIACSNCNAGFYTDEVAQVACDGCPQGYSSSDASSSCIKCVAGKFQSKREQSACQNCLKGRYADELGLAVCKLCGSSNDNGPNKGVKSYQDEVGQQGCKLCTNPGDTASASRDACTTCRSNPNFGVNSYSDANGCQLCKGCSEGSYKIECSATGTCVDCPIGYYKNTTQALVNNQQDMGAGWDTTCTPCTPCPAGKFRDSTDACLSSGARADGIENCKNCPYGRYKISTGAVEDSCDLCSTCPVGATRISCGLESAGTCSVWNKPIITGCDGSGQSGGDTKGNEILNIYGKFFGPIRSTDDIVVKYGPEDPPTSYTAKFCEVIIADAGLLVNNVAANKGHIRCLTTAGVGAGHKISVQIGSYNNLPLLSNTFSAGISYGAPVVATYSGSGATSAITSGGQSLIISGAQFGPLNTVVENATYGDGAYQLQLDVSQCAVTKAHTEITCLTAKGAGTGLKLVLQIGGQTSTIPAINYGAPELKQQKCVPAEDHGKYLEGTTFCGCNRCPSLLINGDHLIPSVTIGNGSCWLRPDKPACPGGQPIPILKDFNGGARLSTKGGQLIVLSGINLGRSGAYSELESVTYGPTGSGIPIDIVQTLTNDKAGCKVHVATFSIICRTPPGIAGPHNWFVIVKGQKSSQKIAIQTKYKGPIINDANYTLGTQGNEQVILAGSEFGTSDAASSFRVIFVKGDFVSSCDDVLTPCFDLPASKMIESGGYERVQFSSPSGFGDGYNIRLIVENSLTGQTAFTDFSGSISYSKPVVDSVTISAGLLSDGYYRVTISGRNFCDRTLSGAYCGMVYRCGGGTDINYCTTNQEDSIPESNIETWTDSKIEVKVNVSTGYVYVQTGRGGTAGFTPLHKDFRSDFRSFNTNAMTIIAGGSFVTSGSDLIYPTSIPTQGGIRLSIVVQKLDGKDQVRAVVNGESTSVKITDVDNSEAGKWIVTFSVPPGVGIKQSLYVSRKGAMTTNRAYISYQKPRIQDVKLKNGGRESLITKPGVIETSGAIIEIIGANFGDPSTIANGNYEIRFRSTTMSVDHLLTGRTGTTILNPQNCVVHTHDKIECNIPPGSGVGYVISVNIGGQTTDAGNTWPLYPAVIDYAPPSVNTVSPSTGPTLNPGIITINGKNFGSIPPTVKIQNKTCAVVIKPSGGYHTSFDCIVADGEGIDHKILVVVGTQQSQSTKTFSYNPPTISSFFPLTGHTSGLNATGGPQQMTIVGTNFGTDSNTNVRIIFETTMESPKRRFLVDGSDILSQSQTSITFKQPRGYGKAIRIKVSVMDQYSDYASNFFVFETPTVTRLAPSCGTDKNAQRIPCYGFSYPGFSLIQDYPKIISVVSRASGACTAKLSFVAGKTFLMEVGDQIRLSGMEKSVGVVTGSPFNFNAEWTVISATTTEFNFLCGEFSSNGLGTPVPDTYRGWNSPTGNFRALASKKYQSSKSSTFRALETDGCSTEDVNGIRLNKWEPYSTYLSKLFNLDANAAQSPPSRECTYKQRIVLDGTGFGSKNVKIFNERTGLNEIIDTPINVTMSRKICDCVSSAAGSPTPCQNRDSLSCAPKNSDNSCPGNYEDCSLSTKYDDPISLEVESHTDTQIVVLSRPGYGRRHRINVVIGSKREAISSADQKFVRYHAPSIKGYETNATVYRPDGKTRISFTGDNLGYGSTGDIDGMIEIRMGVEYDIDGKFCGNEDKCMKLCTDAKWHPSKNDGEESSRGFPYIDCIIPQDTAGFKNVSIMIAGQRDDCSTNRRLCGYPQNYPTDRRTKKLDPNSDISNLVGDPAAGLVFTCSKSTLDSQSYARPGELCQSEINGKCADADCTKPKANAGFWRLDLDLQFACSSSGSKKPCQVDITDDKKFTGASLVDSLNPWSQEESESICYAGSQIGSNKTTCKNGTGGKQRLCTDRGKNTPGTCLFRRPLEARRALGSNFWPWACPGTDLEPYVPSDIQPSQEKCKEANLEAYNFISAIDRPGCPLSRVEHLVNLSKFDEFPGLKMSPVCFSLVACNPKESCIGNNQCSTGYEYQKYRCMAWNKKNPDKLSCTSDDQCRTRSNSTSTKESGLSSACNANNPEDCSRCVFNKSSTIGTCKCVGGGPRCGLCRQAINSENSHDGKDYKGYFRLNDECQECPDDPWLLLILMASAVVVFCVVGWYMQDKKVNVAFLSIGVDYFQVLAIFARIKIRWPQWMKDILQVLSIFNFNIDIAAPECVIPEFDYKIKWVIIMLLPLIFAGILLCIFLLIVVVKFIKKTAGCSGKATRYCSHANKLVATFIVIFYFIYLSITRRALDVFNCNPVDPPDGYLYTEFTSIECEGGICRCDDPSELQNQLKVPAALGICVYSLGFPATVFYLTWYYRIQMKADQLLRAYDLGEERHAALDGMRFTPRAGRSKSRKTYDIRKKYHKLYYHFKPGKVYWMLIILTRKFSVALFALLFRRNISFMLACVILTLFGAYVLQVRNRPYMSTVERVAVKEAHKLKAKEAAERIEKNRIDGNLQKGIPGDLRLHLELNQAIISLRDSIDKRERKVRYSIVKNLEQAGQLIKEKKTIQDYYFDYNTVEQVLIMCCIFLSLVAIMFESGQFYETNPDSGITVLRDDPTTKAFYTTVLVIGAIVLIGSLIYYLIIFIAEVIGHVPNWVRVLFASKKTRSEKFREGTQNHPDADLIEKDDDFEMAEISVYENPIGGSKQHKEELREAKLAQQNAEMQKKIADQQSAEMLNQIRKLKLQNNRTLISKKSTRRKSFKRVNKVRKEINQVRVDTGNREPNRSSSFAVKSSAGGAGGNQQKSITRKNRVPRRVTANSLMHPAPKSKKSQTPYDEVTNNDL